MTNAQMEKVANGKKNYLQIKGTPNETDTHIKQTYF
jgi:hypothetical protein